jgi:hypothetical protein
MVASGSASRVNFAPRHSIQHEHRGDDVGICGGDSQKGARRAERIAASALPVPERLPADSDHVGELAAVLAEFLSDFSDIDRLELDAVSGARAAACAAVPKGA